MAEDVLYIGIDLGTFRSVMVSSGNHEEEELTVIGTPKDPIARNFLKRDVLRPLELGVIKDTKEDREFIAHFITHLIGLSDPEDHDRVVAVIGAPAEASHVDKTAIFDAAAGSVNAAMIISEPFAVAYALDMIEHTLVIDIGAGTTDFGLFLVRYSHNSGASSVDSIENGYDVVSGGTDNHIVLVDLRPKGLTGNISELALERAGITCNKNGVPGDLQPPSVTSGLRFGVSAGTTRGFGAQEFEIVGNLIADVLCGLEGKTADQGQLEGRVAAEVKAMTHRFPIYGSC